MQLSYICRDKENSWTPFLDNNDIIESNCDTISISQQKF